MTERPSDVHPSPRVSIGVPTYNRARFLSRALDALLGQTYRDIEIIVSDNGSTDDTQAVAEAYAARDARVRYIRQPVNLGFAGNLRALLEAARGEHFMWHADDDLAHPRFVERTVEYLDAHPDVVACGTEYDFVDEQGAFLRPSDMAHLHPDKPWDEAQRDFFRHPDGRSVMLVYGMHRTSVLQEVGAPDVQTFRKILSGIETPFLASVAARGRIVVIPERHFSYTEHPNDKASIAHTGSRLAPWELVLLYATIAAKLVGTASTARAPLAQRFRLAGTCVGSIARHAGRRAGRWASPEHLTPAQTSRRPALLAAAMVLLAAAILWSLAPLWAGIVRSLDAQVPSPDVFADHRFAILWAGALGALLFLVPLPRRHRTHLALLWVAKVAVALGFMLLYEAQYGSLDAYGYFQRGAQDAFPEGRLLSGTDNIARLAWIQQQALVPSFHALKVSFAMIGLVACYLLWRAATGFTKRENVLVLYGIALFPSILFWSSILGKDPLVLLGLSLAAYGAVAFHLRRPVTGALAAIAAAVLLALVRPWLVPMTLLPVSIPLLAHGWRRSATSKLVVVGAMISLFAVAAFLISRLFQVTSARSLIYYVDALSRSWAFGGSGQAPPHFETVADLLLFLPFGGFTALFRPLPFEVDTPLFGMLAGLENLLLLSLVVWAAYRARWNDARHPLVVAAILYVAIWTSLYAFISYQNLGSAFRFRMQAAPFVLGLSVWFARPSRAEGPHLFVGLWRASSTLALRLTDALLASAIIAWVLARTAVGRLRRPMPTSAPRLLALDTSYTLHAIRSRKLEHAFTVLDVGGYFEHVWIAHPLVGASLDEPDANATGEVRSEALGSRQTFIEGRVGRTAAMSRLPLANFALAQAQLIARLDRLVRSEKITVIRASDPYYVGLVGLLLARVHRIPFAMRVGGNYDAIYAQLGTPAYPRLFRSRAIEKRIERFVFPRTDLVAAANEDNLRFALNNGARTEKSTVFRYGTLIDPVHFTDPAARTAAARVRDTLGLGTRPYLVYVGRLESVKHSADVVRVLAALAKERPELAAVLVGDGRLRADHEALARQEGVEGSVIFAGNRDQAFVAEALAGAVAVVSPHMGRALVEAALSGTPIAAYDHDWQGEIVRPGETGELVPFKDLDGLIDATRRLLDDVPRATRLGSAARVRALQMMDPEALKRHERAAYDALRPRAAERGPDAAGARRAAAAPIPKASAEPSSPPVARHAAIGAARTKRSKRSKK